MKLTYTIEVKGFDNVPHPKTFYKRWLAEDGPEGLFNKARQLIAGEIENNRYSSQPHHGHPPSGCPGWIYVGCLGAWVFGDPSYADCHCLEVFRDPDGRHFLVDQSEHGDYSGHDFSARVIEEIKP